MVCGLLKVRNCFTKNKQTLDPIWGKRNSSSNLERLENLSSPLTLTLVIGSLLFLLFVLASLSFPFFLPSTSLQLHFLYFPFPLSVVKVISPIHLASFPPLWLTTDTHTYIHSAIWLGIHVPTGNHLSKWWVSICYRQLNTRCAHITKMQVSLSKMNRRHSGRQTSTLN